MRKYYLFFMQVFSFAFMVAKDQPRRSLSEIVRHDSVEDVKKVLSKREDAKADFKEGYPLHSAAERGNPEIVQLLIDAGADVNGKTTLGTTPLHLARNGDVAIVLIKNGASVDERDSNGATPLWDAASSKRLSVVEACLDNGANPHAIGPAKQTVLHIACNYDMFYKQDALMIVILLVGKKVKINEQDIMGNTPLHNAAVSGGEQVVDFLLKKGADPTIKNNNKEIPLHKAAYSGTKKAVELLLVNLPSGITLADTINAQDIKGNTPLHYATLNLNEEVIPYLLEKGASITKANQGGQRPEDLIIAREDREPVREERVRQMYKKHKEKIKTKHKKASRFRTMKALKKKIGSQFKLKKN